MNALLSDLQTIFAEHAARVQSMMIQYGRDTQLDTVSRLEQIKCFADRNQQAFRHTLEDLASTHVNHWCEMAEECEKGLKAAQARIQQSLKSDA